MDDETNVSQTPNDTAPADQLASANTLLAEWAAGSAIESAPLIDRFEAMGYEVRGKSREEIAEALKHPPTQCPKP